MDAPLLFNDRRTHPRYPLNVAVTIVMVNHGKSFSARMLDLSLDGCGLHVEVPPQLVTPSPVEVGFKINGIAFRLGGVLERAEESQVVGVRFAPMVPRRREALIEVLQELEEKASANSEDEDSHRPEGSDLISPTASTHRIDSSRRPQRSQLGPTSAITTCAASKRTPSTPEPGGSTTPGATPHGRERRQQTRHVVDTRVTILFIDVAARATGLILDLSNSGCRIRTDARFPVGIFRRIEMEFWLDGLPFRLGGVVQSLHDGFTVGIRFLDLSPRKREQLRELIEEIEALPGQTPSPALPPVGAE